MISKNIRSKARQFGTLVGRSALMPRSGSPRKPFMAGATNWE